MRPDRLLSMIVDAVMDINSPSRPTTGLSIEYEALEGQHKGPRTVTHSLTIDPCTAVSLQAQFLQVLPP